MRSAEFIASARPEHRLILACARTKPNGPARDKLLDREGATLDWPYLMEFAEEHCVVGLLHRGLAAAPQAHIPAWFLAELAAAAANQLRSALNLTAELVRLVDLAGAVGVSVLPYKGPVLAQEVYGNLALRHFDDLDLLVREVEIGPAAELLMREGYLPVHPFATPAQQAAHMQNHHDCKFIHPEREISVDLQWGVIRRPFIFPEQIGSWWARLEPITMGGRSLPGFSAEDLLLILCVHGAKHLWFRLLWICDVAELVNRRRLDWASLLGRATALGVERILLVGLTLAYSLLGAEVPEDVLARCRRDAAVERLATELWAMLFSQEPHPSASTNRALVIQVQMLERLRDRLKLCARHAPSFANPLRLWRLYGFRVVGSVLRSD